MKVIDLRIDVVRRELPAMALQGGHQPARAIEQGVLRVFTDEGIEGNCLIGAWIPAEPHFRAILDVVKPELVGRDAFEREWLWRRMQFLATRFLLSETSWAPVDVALWDIAGKAAGLPVFKLLGAQRYEVPAYAAYPAAYDTADGFVGEARETLARGFRAYKIHPGRLGPREVAANRGQGARARRRRLSAHARPRLRLRLPHCPGNGTRPRRSPLPLVRGSGATSRHRRHRRAEPVPAHPRSP